MTGNEIPDLLGALIRSVEAAKKQRAERTCPNIAAAADCTPPCWICAPLVQPEGRIEDE